MQEISSNAAQPNRVPCPKECCNDFSIQGSVGSLLEKRSRSLAIDTLEVHITGEGRQ
jgi:hypothetical protein